MYWIVTGCSTYGRPEAAICESISEACAIRFCRKRIASAPRRVMARSPLWASVSLRPVVRRVNAMAAFSNSRRANGISEELSKEPAAKGEIGVPTLQRLHEARDVSCAVLSVGVEGDDDLRSLAERKVDPSLKCGALSQIEGVLDNQRATPERLEPSSILGAVVDNHGPIAQPAHLRCDIADHSRFVESSDDDEDFFVLRSFTRD